MLGGGAAPGPTGSPRARRLPMRPWSGRVHLAAEDAPSTGYELDRVRVVPRSADRPLVFLDVDGTLITFTGRSTTNARPRSTSDEVAGKPLLDRLEPEDGRRL